MKTLILCILVLTIASVSNAQNVYIPDTAFLNALIEEGVDTNGDSLISYAEAEAITSLDVSGWICEGDTCWNVEIESLAGIEAFINLDSLDCNFNDIGTMDISNLVGLKYLNTGFSCICGGGSNLTELDVSNNTELEVLLCHFNQLTDIDVSNNIYLRELDIGCNDLTSLNISNNTELEVLNCHLNQLTSIDVSNNIYLKELDVQRNDLTSLNISNNTGLVDLNLGDMPSLYEVCVWKGFSESIVYSVGSPNVQYTTECLVNIKNDYKENSIINIYPNPSNDIINIEINNPNNATIEIYNVSGRLVFSKALNSKVEKIDISGFPKGIYIVKVMQNSTVYYGKVMVR